MLGRSVVPLASFAWSFGVIALVLKSGILERPPSDQNRARPPDPVTLATTVLRTSDHFSSAAVGEAAIPSEEMLAWRIIYSSPRASEIFEDLLATASVPGQLYALVGLHSHGTTQFSAAAARLAASTGSVTMVRGCIVDRETVADLVKQIEQGYWTRDFLQGIGMTWLRISRPSN